MNITTIDIVLLAAMVLAAVWTAMTIRLMRSVIGLALTSAILTILMFRLDSPIAAVFELSVCAGLIPAIFISTIGLTQRLTPQAAEARRKARFKIAWVLPAILIAAGIALSQARIGLDFAMPAAAAETDVRNVLWNLRHMDLIGQVTILLGGAFAVVILLKGANNES